VANGDTVTIDDGTITQEVDTDDAVGEGGTDSYTAASEVVETALEGDGTYYDIQVDQN
jgi:hypothetical protein